MLQPKKTKYRKQFRGKRRGVATSGHTLAYGEFGLQARTDGWLPSNQIEAARKAVTRYTKRKAKLWIRVFPDKPVTAKPAEVKMGGGKGDIQGYVAVIKPGRIILEVGGVKEDIAKEALRRAAHKIGIMTKIVNRDIILR
jgi:large subunit ribosomal protein L16